MKDIKYFNVLNNNFLRESAWGNHFITANIFEDNILTGIGIKCFKQNVLIMPLNLNMRAQAIHIICIQKLHQKVVFKLTDNNYYIIQYN